MLMMVSAVRSDLRRPLNCLEVLHAAIAHDAPIHDAITASEAVCKAHLQTSSRIGREPRRSDTG